MAAFGRCTVTLEDMYVYWNAVDVKTQTLSRIFMDIDSFFFFNEFIYISSLEKKNAT